MQKERTPLGGRWALWLLGATLLHLPLLVVRVPAPARSASTPLKAPSMPRFEIELVDSFAQPANPTYPQLSPGLPPAATEPAASPSDPGERSAQGAYAESPPASREGIDNPAPAHAQESVGVPHASSAVPTVGDSAARAPLSLEQLGVGASNPFTLGPLSPPATAIAPDAPLAAQRPEARRQRGHTSFQRSMATELAVAEQSRGLGPEGPVMIELERLTRAENVALNSTAVFLCTVDAGGKLNSVALVQSSSDPVPWRRVAQGVRAALAARSLRVPKTGYGMTFRLRVSSRVQLPSGADPGLATSILNIPITKGDGPKSARIEILNILPKLTRSEVALPSGQKLHAVELRMENLLSITGDPADIGSPAKRMVHAHLERLDVTEPGPTPATPIGRAP